MKILVMIMFFLFFEAQANEVVSRIINVDVHGSNEKSSLVFLASGMILKAKDVKIKNVLSEIHVKSHWLKFKIDAKREIKDIAFVSKIEDVNNDFNHSHKNSASDAFTPSILKNLEHARLLFSEAKMNYKESQCYNKAHVWAYDWRIKDKVYSSKIWIFFTRKYIRKYDFGWWFHVAPMVHVVHQGEVKERVMDPKYAKGPIKINDWSDIFIRNRSKCPVVQKYTDYADYPESSYCFLMKSSMYYYQPVDLEHKEVRGIIKNRWIESEVRYAFEEAFDIKL